MLLLRNLVTGVILKLSAVELWRGEGSSCSSKDPSGIPAHHGFQSSGKSTQVLEILASVSLRDVSISVHCSFDFQQLFGLSCLVSLLLSLSCSSWRVGQSRDFNTMYCQHSCLLSAVSCLNWGFLFCFHVCLLFVGPFLYQERVRLRVWHVL